MRTPIHAAVADWVARLVEAGVVMGAVKRNDLVLLSKERMSGFTDGYGRAIPCSLSLGCPASMALTHRKSQSFRYGSPPRGSIPPFHHIRNRLCREVRRPQRGHEILLEGSQGKITTVIIIKLEPFAEGEIEIQKGFVEVWHLIDGKAKKEGERKVTILPTPSRSLPWLMHET